MAKHDPCLQSNISAPEAVLSKRWIVWLIPCLLYATSHFHRVAPTVIFDDLMTAFNTSGAALGALGSIYFYVYALMQIPSGILADTLGPKKTITGGAVTGSLGAFIFGSATTLWLAYLGRFFIGLGMSLIFICIMKLVAEWFRDNEFATMSGLTLFGGNLGSMVATTPLYLLVVAIGWRASFHVIALITVLFGVLTWNFVANRPNSTDSMAEKRSKTEPGKLKQQLLETILNKSIWPTVTMSFGLYGTMLALKGMWLGPYLTQVYGMSRDQATNYVLLSLVAGLIGPLMMGFLSDRIGRRKLPIMLFTPLYLVIWLLLAFWNGGMPPLAALPYLLIMLGIFCSPAALTWACAKEVSHPSVVGLATGIANIGGFLGGAVMQFLFGYILDLNWQGTVVNGLRIYPVEAYQSAFLVTAGVVFSVCLPHFLSKKHIVRISIQEIR